MCGSAESVPSGSISAPCGSALPPLEATRTLPSATSEVAKSSTTGGSVGTPTLKGAVEKRRSVPPKGATSTLPGDVDEMDGDQPGGQRLFGIGADAADMAGIASAR